MHFRPATPFPDDTALGWGPYLSWFSWHCLLLSAKSASGVPWQPTNCTEKPQKPQYFFSDYFSVFEPSSAMAKQLELEFADESGLTDSDWAEIEKLKCAYDSGGEKGLSKAVDKLEAKDIIQFITVVGAFYPDRVKEIIKNEMAEGSLASDDLRELLRKLESPTGKR
jgi:hypothetical protein